MVFPETKVWSDRCRLHSWIVINLLYLSCLIYLPLVSGFLGGSLNGSPSSRPNSGGKYQYESYQRSIRCVASSPPIEPRSLSEIQNIVHRAAKSNKTLKVVGSLHSVTDCICTEGLVLNLTKINHFSYDRETQRATVGVGMHLLEFMEKLHQYGRGLQSAPSYSLITVGGALGTGAHGSGLIHPTTLSDQVFSVTVVDGMGNVRKVNATQEDLNAFRVNLGLLGVIYEVVVDTTPQYKLEITNFPVQDEILFNGSLILDIARSHDFFQFWWFPTNKAVVLSVGKRVPVHELGNCETHQISEFGKVESNAFSVGLELMQAARDYIGFYLVQSYAKLSLYKRVPVRSPFFSKPDGETPCLPSATGFSHRMITNGCTKCFWMQGELSLLEDDSNIAIPVEELYPALETLREIMSNELVGFPLNGVYFRFLQKSSSYISMNSGRDSVSIEWITNPRFDKSKPKLCLTAYQAIGQALVKKHGGRPHWGKNGLMYHHPDIIQRVHPLLPKFIQAMEKYDPRGVFMNDFGARIRYGKNQMTVAEEMLEKCALTEMCVCQSNLDCGDGGPLDFECGDFLGYKVCKARPNPIDKLKVGLSRKVIETIADGVNNEDYIFNALTDYKVFGNMFLRRKASTTSI